MAADTIGIKTRVPVFANPIPRHREINERLAKHIIKTLSDQDAISGMIHET